MEPCGFTLYGESCQEVGNHFCENRAKHAEEFIRAFLVHTKGKYARKQFQLREWQRDDIIYPIFGTTEWSEEHECYRRQYRIAWIEMARKNGKSEILAAIMLYIFFCDGEYSAELFSVATDRKQAALIFDVAKQMILLNPKLATKCKVVDSTKRIVKRDSNSVYQVIANDAASALGSNPSAVAADEILAWPNGDMWNAVRTGMGSMARLQPLLIAATTAGNDTESFGGREHKEMEKIRDDPSRAPHVFVYMRNTPMDADPFDESNWAHANPALGDFLSLSAMREMALEAKNNPAKLNAYRQFQMNQWTTSSIAWMPMHLFDAEGNRGTLYDTNQKLFKSLEGRVAWFGLDLAARQDLTSICYCLPADDGSVDMLWRHYAPEAAVEKLDRLHDGRFSYEFEANGWLTVTEGEVLDFEKVYADVEADAKRFQILGGDADKWSSDPVIQEIERRTYCRDTFAYTNDFRNMSDGMHRIFELVTLGKFRHHGNPLARFCFNNCEARVAKYDPDLIRPDKPDRQAAAKRIDAVPASIMAVNAWFTRGGEVDSIYNNTEVLAL